MGVTKPYYRIYRPGSGTEFLNDTRYCNESNELYRAFQLLELDLKRIFEFIEPTDNNLKTYSNRLYELLLRACTEVEASAKAILVANGYNCDPDDLNMKNYRLVNNATRLSEYKVTLETWNPKPIVLHPFKTWKSTHTLEWYSAYNTVKHNRFKEYEKASLNNVINAIAGVYAILYSQIGYLAITGIPRKNNWSFYMSDDDGNCSPVINNSIFTIEQPKWAKSDKYDFNWQVLKDEPEPFTKFIFEH